MPSPEKFLRVVGLIGCIVLAGLIFRSVAEKKDLLRKEIVARDHSQVSLPKLKEHMTEVQRQLAQTESVKPEQLSEKVAPISKTTFGETAKSSAFTENFNHSVAGKIGARYDLLLKELNLSPEQSESLRKELIQRSFALGYDDHNYNSATYLASIEESRAKSESKIREILSAEQFLQYKRYEDEIPSRNLIKSISNLVAVGGDPMPSSDSASILQMLLTNSKDSLSIQYANSSPHRIAKALDSSFSFIEDRTLEDAKHILSPKNYDILIQIRKQQDAELLEQEFVQRLN